MWMKMGPGDMTKKQTKQKPRLHYTLCLYYPFLSLNIIATCDVQMKIFINNVRINYNAG